MRTFEMPFATTRGALEKTLAKLGYMSFEGTNEVGYPFIGYKHEESGDLVLLKPAPSDQAVEPVEMLQCEHSVEWWGIAAPEKFYRLLKQATPQKAKVA